MSNKYYTPTIEEFHVGFEYEFHGMTTGGLSILDTKNNKSKTIQKPHIKIWNKEIIYKDSIFNRNLTSISELINSNQIRVKYLDKEDIESLGFVKRNPENNNKSSDYFKMKAPGEIAYWTEIDLDFRWGFKDVSIRGVRGNEDDYLFRGTIKNKSELKRLLKQLGV